MTENRFLPQISKQALDEALRDPIDFYDLLVEPLHEELYKRQSFDFLDDLSEGQQLLLSYDYVRNQVRQGGFIQLIQNGYIPLLPAMPETLLAMRAPEMAKLIDDVLRVYVLNHEALGADTTPEQFAKLYDEFKEFEALDERFTELDEDTITAIVHYAKDHLEEFINLTQ